MKSRLNRGAFLTTVGTLVLPLACNNEVVVPGGHDPEPENPGSFFLSAGGGPDTGDGDACSGNAPGGTSAGPDIIGEPTPGATGQVDVLFVVDNSVGSPSREAHFKEASLELIDRLARPRCVGSSEQVNEDGECPEGSTPEFAPVRDMNVGVITTSLGFQPGSPCTEINDRAHLIGEIRPDVPNPLGTGHLTYSGDAGTLDGLKEDLTKHLAAVGDAGCGFESPLEAAYRFLVEPAPFESMSLSDALRSVPEGVDHALLDQRASFLRPESAVIVVLLTNEDDCSGLTGDSHYQNASRGWLMTDPTFSMPHATRQCASDPNDPCCRSCIQQGSDACDPSCNDRATIERAKDPVNLRCFDQKRRFGMDLLYPTERYIDGFSKTIVRSQKCGFPAPNPLFTTDGVWTRSPNKVFFTAIVGAPWQDLATTESLTNDDMLQYLSPTALSRKDISVDGNLASRWDLLLGDRTNNIAPLDPFMVGSMEPRTGSHPLVSASMVGPGESGTNIINGHEFYAAPLGSGSPPFSSPPTGLQYACIAPLADPYPCDPEDFSCDCAFEPSDNLSICKEDPQAEATATTTQHFSAAVPAPRILEVTRGLGSQGIVASACAKTLDPESPAYGYRPAMDAAILQVQSVLQK